MSEEYRRIYVKIPVGPDWKLGRSIQREIEKQGYVNVTVQQENPQQEGRMQQYFELGVENRQLRDVVDQLNAIDDDLRNDIKTIATQRDEFRGRLKRATELLAQLDTLAELATGDHGRYNYNLGKKVEELRFTLRSGTEEGEHKK